jgi:hypothetical protein
MGGIARTKAPSGLGRKPIIITVFVSLISLAVFCVFGNVRSVPSPLLSLTLFEEQEERKTSGEERETSGEEREIEYRQAVTSRLHPSIIENPDRLPRPICRATGGCARPYFPLLMTVECPKQANADVSTSGAWIISANYLYILDQRLADAILTFVSGDLLELGAGLGCYSHYFRDSRKLSRVVAVEGASNVAELTGGFVFQADLTQEHNFGHFHWVITLEVAEHIPKQFEDVYIRNIVSTSPYGIIISWALPGQGGVGHVNPQTNEYVIELMSRQGYDFDLKTTQFLRGQADVDWFKRTTMVFTRRPVKK